MHIVITDDSIVNHDLFLRMLYNHTIMQYILYNHTKYTQLPDYSLSVDRTMSDTYTFLRGISKINFSIRTEWQVFKRLKSKACLSRAKKGSQDQRKTLACALQSEKT